MKKNDWSVRSLKEYIEKIICAKFKTVEKQLESMDKALTKAESALEKRLESVNEFRANLADQTRTFIPRVEIEQAIQQLRKDIDNNETRLNSIRDMKSGGNVVWAYVIAGIGAVGGLVALILTFGGG